MIDEIKKASDLIFKTTNSNFVRSKESLNNAKLELEAKVNTPTAALAFLSEHCDQWMLGNNNENILEIENKKEFFSRQYSVSSINSKVSDLDESLLSSEQLERGFNNLDDLEQSSLPINPNLIKRQDSGISINSGNSSEFENSVKNDYHRSSINSEISTDSGMNFESSSFNGDNTSDHEIESSDYSKDSNHFAIQNTNISFNKNKVNTQTLAPTEERLRKVQTHKHL